VLHSEGAEKNAEEGMVAIHAEKLHDLAVVECKGRIVRSDSVFKLRDFVQAQAPVRTIALDLSEVEAIDGGGLGMLAFLERWARQKGIGFKLFSPSRPVLQGLAQNRSILNFKITGFHEMMTLTGASRPALSCCGMNQARRGWASILK
jgi:anti-anti-sigma regulatory factor